jgi:RNA polymerase sigma-70 factor (sigma-E family)
VTETSRTRADEALTVLARERWGALTGYAYLLTGDVREAEDLIQDAFVKTFTRARSIELPGAEGYVRRAILTTFIDGHRRRRRWDTLVHLVARPDHQEGDEARVAERQDVQAALRGLPPQQRACVVLRFYDDLPVAEIAARLGLSPGSVKRYLSMANRRLEGVLGPQVTQEDEGRASHTVLVEEGGQR